MPEMTPIEAGDVIVYAANDAGGDLSFPDEITGKKRAWRLVPNEPIIVGKDLPTDYCRALVMQGICRPSVTGQTQRSRVYYWACGGGIGDALLSYVGDPWIRRLPALHEKYGPFEVWVYSKVHNDGIEDLFRLHPYITRHIQDVQLPQDSDCGTGHGEDIFPGIPPLHSLDIAGLAEEEPPFNLYDWEEEWLNNIRGECQLLAILQPFAGLDERDCLDSDSVDNLAEAMPGWDFVVTGKNHGRVSVGRAEQLGQLGKRVCNMIDQMGIRLTIRLLQSADAFIGCHSSLILMAWHFRSPNALILPWPLLEAHWGRLDPVYKQGEDYPESLVVRYQANSNTDRDFGTVPIGKIATHLNKCMEAR